MKKRNIFTSIFILFVLMQAQAQLQGIRICLDPGHGGHDPANDRRIQLPHGIVFWESEGNLTTALHERDYLQALGANVKMTRTSNTDADDISLSSRVAIANAFNADYFHSNHTNAGYAGVNYSLVLFNGTDNNPTWPNAKSMGNIMAPNLEDVLKTTRHYNRGDISFLGFNLGVLRNTNMPATLSEGSFHDIPDEALRLKNDEYLKNYAWALAKSYCKYFNVQGFSTGRVGGVVKDKKTGKVINNIQVFCSPGDKSYTGDDYYNGFYAIGALAPGTYTLTFKRSGYLPATRTVTIRANKYNDMDVVLVPDNNGSPYADFTIKGLPAGAGDTLIFDASLSADDSMIVKYAWNFGDNSPVDTGKIVKHAFAKDSIYTVTLTVTDNSQNESTVSKKVTIKTTPPAAPELLYVKFVNDFKGVKIKWKKPNNPHFAGYRIYYNINPYYEDINILADTNILKPGMSEIQIDSIGNDLTYYFYIVAMKKSGVESLPSDRYGISHYPFDDNNKKLLIIDGFHRRASYSKSYHEFASVSYLYPLYEIESHVDVNTCLNNSIISGDIKLTDYDIVFWFLGDESTADETFSSHEQSKVKQYLQNGGKLFVTGSEIGWDLDHKGNSADKAFYHNYLKARYVSDGAKGRSPASGKDEFARLRLHYGVVYEEDYPDVLAPYTGAHSIFTYNQGSVAGIAYKGSFGQSSKKGAVVNLGFALETVKDINELKAFFKKLLNYFDTKVSIPYINKDINSPGITVYPTFFEDRIFIKSLTDNAKNLRVMLFDMKGNKVFEENMILPGNTVMRMAVPPIADGMYILKAFDKEKAWSFKMLRHGTK